MMIDEIVLLAISQRDKWLHERSRSDGSLRVLPLLCEYASGTVDQEPREFATTEVLVERGRRSLRNGVVSWSASGSQNASKMMTLIETIDVAPIIVGQAILASHYEL